MIDGKPKTPTHEDVASRAYYVIKKTLDLGADSHGRSVWYLNESMSRQTLLAARHLCTYMLQQNGEKTSDGEDHLVNALVRCAMALAKRDDCGSRPE